MFDWLKRLFSRMLFPLSPPRKFIIGQFGSHLFPGGKILRQIEVLGETDQTYLINSPYDRYLTAVILKTDPRIVEVYITR